MAASSSDIRDWARQEGRAVPDRGRIGADLRADYEAAHAGGGEGDTYPDPYADADGARFAADAGGSVSDATATAEQPPRAARRAPRSQASGWLGRARKPKSGKGRKEKRSWPRVPVDRLIEHAWGDIAWAAGSLPPLQKMLYAQAPLAGKVFEDIVRDTAIDTALQPAARLEAKMDAAYGMIGPPLGVLAVMATAPEPGHEPTVAHKAAWVSLRHSLLVMARVGGPNMAEIEDRAKANAEQSADVDRFIRFLFDIPAAEGGGADEAVAEAGVLYASAVISPEPA